MLCKGAGHSPSCSRSILIETFLGAPGVSPAGSRVNVAVKIEEAQNHQNTMRWQRRQSEPCLLEAIPSLVSVTDLADFPKLEAGGPSHLPQVLSAPDTSG